MNEQEMQFADPDWKPTGPLPAPQAKGATGAPSPASARNTSYDASQSADIPSYDQGYQGYQSSWQQGQAPYISPAAQQMPGRQAGTRRRGSAWWIWLIVIVIVISMLSSMSHSFNGGGFGRGSSQQASSPQQVSTYYPLGGISQLAITDSAGGSITVQVGDASAGGVTVQTDDSSQPDANSTGGSLAIDSKDSGTVVVTIPQNAALSLSINAQSVEVDGFSGQLSAQTDSGSITLNNDTLSGQSSINSNSGDIALSQDNLSGQVAVKTGGNGGIDFNGTLDPQGKYQFTTDSGDVTLNLPATTSMQVRPSSGTGTYQSDFAHNPTGKAPGASVTVSTNSGNISIHNSY